jgi:hypothetical protein
MTRRRMKMVALIALVLIGIGLAVWRSQPPVITQSPDQKIATSFPPQEEPTSNAIPNDNAQIKAPAAVAASKSIGSLAPSRARVRKEIEANPHEPPPSMIQFTLQLYNRRVQALKTETEAQQFFADLETCAMNKDSAFNAQGMCLLNAKYLQDRYPVFGSRFTRLQSDATPEALKFMRGITNRRR